MSSDATGNRKCDSADLDGENEAKNPSKVARRPNDEQTPVADARAEMKWRGPPEDTFSDWKIEIVTTKPRLLTTARRMEEMRLKPNQRN